MTRTALFVATLLAAAPLSATAQEAVDTAPPQPAPATASADKPRAQPVWSPSATSGVVLAIYKKWNVQAAPKLMRTDTAAGEAVPKIEIRGKDEWADEYGMKVAFNKVSYKARF